MYTPTKEQIEITEKHFPEKVITKEEAAKRIVAEAINTARKLAGRTDISHELGAVLMELFAQCICNSTYNVAIFQACGVDTSDLCNLTYDLIMTATSDKAAEVRQKMTTGRN